MDRLVNYHMGNSYPYNYHHLPVVLDYRLYAMTDSVILVATMIHSVVTISVEFELRLVKKAICGNENLNSHS